MRLTPTVERCREARRREGTFRLTGPEGRCAVEYRLTRSTVVVRVETRPKRIRAVLKLRPRAPVSFVAYERTDGEGAFGKRDVWDLRNEDCVATEVLEYALQTIGLEPRAAPDRYTAARGLARRLMRALLRGAIARTDPGARAIAQTFDLSHRSRIYRWIVDDRSGRVRQMASVCPGLLSLAAALAEPRGGDGLRTRALLDGIVAGRALRPLISEATELALTHERGDDTLRARLAPAHVAAVRLLIRRARSLVRGEDLLGPPLPTFAPEDIPCEPVRNGRWYATTRRATDTLWHVHEPELRAGLSSFLSAHALLLASRGRRVGFLELVQRLLRFSRATGRVPSRRSSPLRILAECDRWWRDQQRDTPAGRLGELLRRLPALGLGELVSVHALEDDQVLTELERVALPAAPVPPELRGLEARLLWTPEELAAEGERMHHCVASWLPRLLAGDTWVYAVRIAGEDITVAVERSIHGRLRIAEARRRDDLEPTPVQARLLEAWVARMDALATEGA